MMQKIIIIGGATATGKSAATVAMAQSIGGEIISADSMQIYRKMDIGTAKVMPNEMKGIPHHLIDELDPDEPYNVAIFAQMAKRRIEEIAARNKVPIICGGTGFYINALLYGADFSQTTADHDLRRSLEQKSVNELWGILQKVDPNSAKQLDKNNKKRVVRAIEYNQTTGEKISEHNERERARSPAYDAKVFLLDAERSLLYGRINSRVDDMVANGLVSEVQGLLDAGYSPNLVSMQGIGYKEIVRYLQGECSLDEAIAAIKQATRRFAKRQITWFKHQLPQAVWVDIYNQKLEDFI
ncbi:MAG: tRNA (adenosine(37)-N6)-dimethylallyltransferase MiaA [Defluviitaleaceae bacterium]|nr:tRNA (adenosine(37)-N6)-dimethylallyltransferase MiaA [Defluviitaleaceae bacterium]